MNHPNIESLFKIEIPSNHHHFQRDSDQIFFHSVIYSMTILLSRSILFGKIGGVLTKALKGGTMAASASTGAGFPILAEESIMSKKAHGTCDKPVQENLLWGCDNKKADEICCFNRHYAEHSGYWELTKFLKEVSIYMYVLYVYMRVSHVTHHTLYTHTYTHTPIHMHLGG